VNGKAASLLPSEQLSTDTAVAGKVKGNAGCLHTEVGCLEWKMRPALCRII
jgi:hypothetical protein